MVPSLQNPYMLAHPPMLYLGYVGLTIPWAFAMGSLLAGRTDERWIVATRRWTLGAWAFLGVGQLLGAHWAYEEVGWGGYYAWDPVENAALMPWLAATAYLHSVMIQEKRGMLRLWNMSLVTLAFGLSLFGTFLTRSGILTSIHSFTQSSIGSWFLGFIVVVAAFSVALILWRLPLLRSKTRLESLVSREATFLYNNLLLVALVPDRPLGRPVPDRLRGGARHDAHDRAAVLQLLPARVRAAAAAADGDRAAVAWRRASLRSVGRTFVWPFAVSLARRARSCSRSAPARPSPGLLAYTFSAFVLASIAIEFVRGTRARKALGARTWPGAFSSLIAQNRRRYGGYIVHAAIVLLAIGIAGSSAYQTVAEVQARPGQTFAVGDYVLRHEGARAAAGGERDRDARHARGLRATDGDLGDVRPGKNRYPVEDQVSNEVAIRSDLLTGEDLFVIADQIDPDGTVYFKVFVKPLVNLVWLAGLVFVLGALVTMWPDAREARRLALRYEGEGAAGARA